MATGQTHTQLPLLLGLCLVEARRSTRLMAATKLGEPAFSVGVGFAVLRGLEASQALGQAP